MATVVLKEDPSTSIHEGAEEGETRRVEECI
jgi:hypothetical protein